MPPTPLQRQLTLQFITITGASEKVAASMMKRNAYKLDLACDAYFLNSGNTGPSSQAEPAVTALFEKYRDAQNDEKDEVGINGMMEWLGELAVDLESVHSLIPLEIIQAPSLGAMTKRGFVDGWIAAGEKAGSALETPAKQRSYLAAQNKIFATDKPLFKKVYKHTFVCAKERDQKALPLENALTYWQMLFSAQGMAWVTSNVNWLELWTEYLSEKWTKSVNKDMWNQTLEFAQKTLDDETMGFWSEDGAWPGVIDDFVAYARAKGLGTSMNVD